MFLPRLCSLLLLTAGLCSATELTLTAPLDFQVVQRRDRAGGLVPIRGQIAGEPRPEIEARVITGAGDAAWAKVPVRFEGDAFSGELAAPAGGWFRCEVRAVESGKAGTPVVIEHVGIGEVFVVAGQSNSANHGEGRQTPASGRVASFTGTRWQLAADPQPGASGGGGSFMPALGDALVQRLEVPIGFVACGIGATSVREWLPKGVTFPNPPTIEGRVEKLPSGEWASKGAAFDNLVARMKALGPQGFRAVLWHQGESDANQRDASRTLPGPLYRDYLARIIRDSRRAIGWDAPWFVAQVSYHVPGDEAAPDIRAAQAALAAEGLALAGPDSDALKGEWRERQGQGVHFSAAGLRVHGTRWAEKIAPWLAAQLAR